jgi:hypothetical protein
MFDEAWAAVAALWAPAEALLGGRCVLEPSFTAFRLSHAAGGAGQYVPLRCTQRCCLCELIRFGWKHQRYVRKGYGTAGTMI